MNAFLGLILLLAGFLGAVDEDSHRAPVKSLARPAVDERRAILAEMWQRGLVAMDRNSWGSQDQVLLERIRRAEAQGAAEFVRRRVANSQGLVLRDRPSGSAPIRSRLTRRGFEQYLRLRTQEALDYFASKEIETKWAYGLTDRQGRALFDKDKGLLTDAGDELYSRALLNQPVFWKMQDGSLMGNRSVPAK